MLISHHFATAAAKNLNRAAFNYLGKDINYGDVRTKIARLSYLFQNELGPQARVAFLTSNHPAVAMTFFALSNIRAITIPLDPSWLADELIACLKESKATHLAVTSDLVSV